MATSQAFKVFVGILPILSISVSQIHAFAPSHHFEYGLCHRRACKRIPLLNALIYYPDNSTAYDDSSHVLGFTAFPTNIDVSIFGQLANQLSGDSSLVGKLAKVAWAHSPPGYQFNLENVNDVRCSALDNNHMEIEAVVCGDMECSSLLVPVSFPEECAITAYEGMDECVRRNIGHLDDSVSAANLNSVTVETNVFQHEDEAGSALAALQSLDPLDYAAVPSSKQAHIPEWWESPISSTDIAECELLKDLLNGNDMYDIILELARNVMSREKWAQGTETECSATIQSARVLEVGSIGIMLKVVYSRGVGSNIETVATVAFKYENMSNDGYLDRKSVREEVLRMLSLAS